MERQRRANVWESDDKARVQKALQNGYNPNCYDNDGATGLHRVAETGKLNSLKALLDHDITRTDVLDHMHRTPLHYAARCAVFDQSLQATTLLLERGLDINAECHDVDCPTPLFIAIEHRNIELATLLLERGANIGFTNFSDLTPLTYLLVNHSNYVDAVLEELVHLLLYYNVDVNYSFNTHAFFLALLSTRGRFLSDVLIDYFAGYDFLQCVNLTREMFRHDFCHLTVSQCVKMMKYDADVIIRIVDKLDLSNTKSLINSLLETGQLEDSKLFNHLYSKLQLRTVGCAYHYLDWFYRDNNLNKTGFMDAIEKLLDPDLDINWFPDSYELCYVYLFEKIKPRLDLQLADMERIMCQMFLKHFVMSGLFLNIVFDLNGFTDEFEIFLKCDISVYFERTDIGSLYFKQLCSPAHQPRENQVKSLICLSRNVIRRCLHPQVSFPCRGKSVNCFRYYNYVQKLQVPKVIKDIITLKVLKD